MKTSLFNRSAPGGCITLASIMILLVASAGRSAASTITGRSFIDTSKNHAYGESYSSAYAASYATDPGYTSAGKNAIAESNAKRNTAMLNAMLKDKLISDIRTVSFRMGNEGFYVNGIKQTDAVFEKYKKAFVPQSSRAGEWLWTYNISDASK